MLVLFLKIFFSNLCHNFLYSCVNIIDTKIKEKKVSIYKTGQNE
jgi:hypothetical protein